MDIHLDLILYGSKLMAFVKPHQGFKAFLQTVVMMALPVCILSLGRFRLQIQTYNTDILASLVIFPSRLGFFVKSLLTCIFDEPWKTMIFKHKLKLLNCWNIWRINKMLIGTLGVALRDYKMVTKHELLPQKGFTTKAKT